MSYNGPPPPPPYGYGTPNMPPQVSGDRPPLAPLKKSAFTRSDWTALLTRGAVATSSSRARPSGPFRPARIDRTRSFEPFHR